MTQLGVSSPTFDPWRLNDKKKPKKVWSWRAVTKTKTFLEFEKLKWKCMSTQKCRLLRWWILIGISSTSSGIDPNTFVGSRFLFFFAVDNLKFLQCNDKKGLVQIIACIFALCCLNVFYKANDIRKRMVSSALVAGSMSVWCIKDG